MSYVIDLTTVPYIGDDSKALVFGTAAPPDDGPVKTETCRIFIN